jgi:hypothetical protein
MERLDWERAEERCTMTEDELMRHISTALRPLGGYAEPAEEYREPSLYVLGYFPRVARLNAIPVLGRSLSLVAVVRQPADIDRLEHYSELLKRIGEAVNRRFPPWRRSSGLSIALTAVVTTVEPIVSSDDDALARFVMTHPIPRVVTLGLARINLGQEALAFALAAGPPGVYTEPTTVIDSLTPHLRRFVPFVTG